MLAWPRPLSRRRAAALALGLALAAVALASCVGAAPAPSTTTTASREAAACGAATQATLAAVDATVAQHIYANELAGREVSLDVAGVTGAADLRRAVGADDAAATLRAARRIVYHPAWHIVRLRVFDASGRLLADFGGAHVIAPVAGVLKSGSRTIGRFVMSVQDDIGETKLETRFVGDPVAIYVSGSLVAERYATFPVSAPPGPSLTIGATRYAVVSQTFRAVPSGELTEVMLVPPPAPSLRRLRCPLVRAQEFGRVARRLAALATDLGHQYPGYAATVATYTGVEVFVLSGSRLLGTSAGGAPAKPPTSGTLAHRGKSWLVFSFQPLPPARIYLLIPPL